MTGPRKPTGVVFSNANGEVGKAVKNLFKCSTGFYMRYVFTCVYVYYTGCFFFTGTPLKSMENLG